MASTPSPNRMRLLAPLDYLAIMAGVTPPEPEPPMPIYDVPFQVQPPMAPQQIPPMPFAEPPMPPALPPRVPPRPWGL